MITYPKIEELYFPFIDFFKDYLIHFLGKHNKVEIKKYRDSKK